MKTGARYHGSFAKGVVRFRVGFQRKPPAAKSLPQARQNAMTMLRGYQNDKLRSMAKWQPKMTANRTAAGRRYAQQNFQRLSGRVAGLQMRINRISIWDEAKHPRGSDGKFR